jgi:hypothetical protein
MDLIGFLNVVFGKFTNVKNTNFYRFCQDKI